jgi:hypothetical protein
VHSKFFTQKQKEIYLTERWWWFLAPLFTFCRSALGRAAAGRAATTAAIAGRGAALAAARVAGPGFAVRAATAGLSRSTSAASLGSVGARQAVAKLATRRAVSQPALSGSAARTGSQRAIVARAGSSRASQSSVSSTGVMPGARQPGNIVMQTMQTSFTLLKHYQINLQHRVNGRHPHSSSRTAAAAAKTTKSKAAFARSPIHTRVSGAAGKTSTFARKLKSPHRMKRAAPIAPTSYNPSIQTTTKSLGASSVAKGVSRFEPAAIHPLRSPAAGSIQ